LGQKWNIFGQISSRTLTSARPAARASASASSSQGLRGPDEDRQGRDAAEVGEDRRRERRFSRPVAKDLLGQELHELASEDRVALRIAA
jgi:hypothetical protein